MLRVVLAVIGIAVVSTSAHAEDWSIVAPSGWNRVEPTGAYEADGLPAGQRRYVSSATPSDELVIVKMTVDSPPRAAVGEFLDRAATNPGTRVEKRAIAEHAGETTGTLTLVADHQVSHIRVLAAIDHIDVGTDIVFARCTTTPSTSAPCVDALASLKLMSNPAPRVDDSNVIRVVLVIFGAIVVLAWVVMLLRGVLRRRLTRMKTPLRDGELVTLTGIVRSIDKPLVAPLSGTSCVVHRSRIYVLGAPANNAVTEGSRFLVETPDGQVIVDATPELDLVPSAVVPRVESRERTFMASLGIPEASHRDAGFDEIVVAPGSTVVIRGMVRIDRDHDANIERGYRDDAPTVNRLVGTDTVPLTIRKRW